MLSDGVGEAGFCGEGGGGVWEGRCKRKGVTLAGLGSGWVGSGWVGSGWVGLSWVRLSWIGLNFRRRDGREDCCKGGNEKVLCLSACFYLFFGGEGG